MTKITENAKWEDDVYLIEREDRVTGGRNGIANIQAKQLADRTQYLKLMISSNIDFKELTFFITNNDPDGTLAGLAGTGSGQVFRVAQGTEADTSFIYYLNDQGTAIAISATLGKAAIEGKWGVDTAQALALDPWTGYAFGVSGKDEKFPWAITTHGAVKQPIIETDEINGLGFKILNDWSGFKVAFTDRDNRSPWAIRYNGTIVQPVIETESVGLGAMTMTYLDPWSGYVMAVEGLQGKSPWAIKSNGAVKQPVIETERINDIGFKELNEWSGFKVAFTGGNNITPWGIRFDGTVVQPSIEVDKINGEKYIPFEMPTMLIPKATQEWWISPLHTKLYQPYERIVSGSYGEKGEVYACESVPGFGTTKIVQVGKTPLIDDHNAPALWIEPTRRPVITWTRHGADNIISMRVGDRSGNIDTFLLEDEIKIDIGAAATYTQIHKIKHLSNDNTDVLWIFTRWGFLNWGYKQISINQLTGVVDVSAPFVNLFVKDGQLYISTADAYNSGEQVIRITVCENPATVNSEIQYFELNCVSGAITTPLQATFLANTNNGATIPVVTTNVTPLLPNMGNNNFARRMFYVRPGPISPGMLYAEWSRATPDEAIYKSIVLINGEWIIREHGIAGPKVGFTSDANYIAGMSYPTPCFSDVLYSAHFDKENQKGVLKEQYIKSNGDVMKRTILEVNGIHLSRPMPPVNGSSEITYSHVFSYSKVAFTFNANLRSAIIKGELK